MAYGGIPSIGALRYLVTLTTRTSAPDGQGGLTEAFVNPIQVYADITPIGLQTYFNGAEIGTPITHRITLRGPQEGLDEFDVVLRQITLPSGSTRQEIYRIRRMAEWNGRQRFIVIDAELERRVES